MTQGDIFLTRAQAVAVGLSANGRLPVTPFFTVLHDRHPVFVSDYQKRCRAGGLTPGDIWVWRESQPWLVGLIVRETALSAARLRYVETVMLNLHKDWQREGLHSLALMRLEDGPEWAAAREIVEGYARRMGLSLVIYDAYVPGMAAELLPDAPDNQGAGPDYLST